MSQVAISVIIPAYNVENYLSGCIESVLNQTYQDFEIIIVDDGSPDKCGQIADLYAQKDKRIHVIHQENKGLSGARNSGLRQAQGKMIFFLDSDDYIHPQTLEALVTALNKTNSDIATCDLMPTSEPYHPIDQKYDLSQMMIQKIENPLDCFVRSKKIRSNVMKLYKKEVIQNTFFIEGIYFEDVPFTVMTLHRSSSIALIDLKMYYYFKSPVSIMRSGYNLKKIDSYVRLIRDIDAYVLEHCPQKRAMVRKGVLNKRLKMMMSQCVRKQKDSKELYHLFDEIAHKTKALYQEGLVNYEGLKLSYKIALWLLLNRPNGKMACFWLKWL